MRANILYWAVTRLLMHWIFPSQFFVSQVPLFVEPLPLLIGPRGIVFHAFCVYPLFAAAVDVVLFVVIFSAGVVVATTTAYVAVVAAASTLVVAAVSFIALSGG